MFFYILNSANFMGDVTRMDDVVSVAIWGRGCRVYMEIRKCRILLPASEPVAYRLVFTNNYWVGWVGQSLILPVSIAIFLTLSKKFSGKIGSAPHRKNWPVAPYAYGCLSVMLRYCGHIVWVTLKVISWYLAWSLCYLESQDRQSRLRGTSSIL